MAVTLGDNIQNNSPKALDNRTGRFVSGAWRPYLSIAEANQYVPQAYRHKGLTVWIAANSSTTPVEYTWLNGVTDADLVVKPGGSSSLPLYRTAGPYKFDNAPGVFYGTPVAPLSGNIALDNTEAIDGTSIVIYHQAATEPTITGGEIDPKGTYDTNGLNRIFVLREIGNYYLVNIWSKAEVVTEPPAVTLSSIEAAPEANTINEGDDVSIDVTATYSDGSTADVTNSATFTKVSGSGTLTGNTYATGTISADETAQIDVSYTEGGVTRTDSVSVAVVNNIPGDTTAPTISNVSVNGISQNAATFNAQLNENGSIFWAATIGSASQLSKAAILAGTGAVDFGSMGANANDPVSAVIDGLSASTAYKVHYYAEDAAANETAVSVTANFTTLAAAQAVQLNTPILTATSEQNGTHLKIDWIDTNSSPNEAGFEIYASVDSSFASPSIYQVAADAITHTVSLAVSQYDYHVKIRAKGNGTTTLNSDWSTPIPYSPAAPAVWGNFNGSTSELSRAANFDLNQDFELEFLFLANTGGNLQGLIANQTSTEFTNKLGLVCWLQTASSEVRMQVYSDAGATVAMAAALPTMYGIWHHLKIQRSGTKLYLIVDGVMTSATVGTLVNSVSNKIRYGSWSTSAAAYRLSGSTADISSTANIAYEIADPSTGTDTSGNGNNFTPTNITQGS